MPLVVRVTIPTAGTTSYAPSIDQPMYDTTYISCNDLKTDKIDWQPAHVSHDEIAQPNDEVAREVPYYAEEEAFPELACEVPLAVAVPDMFAELRRYYPTSMTTRWMPPPPPVHSAVTSFCPMRFWHARLLSHPLYLTCSRLVGYRCPAPSDSPVEENGGQWAAACVRWWSELSAAMAQRDMLEMTPTRSWNPYNLRNNVVFHQPRNRDGSRRVEPLANTDAARFPVPPPPSGDLFFTLYTPTVGYTACEQMFIDALARWWHSACEWAAAASVARRWVCPPPTTEATAAAWGDVLSLWWTNTSIEMRMEEEKRKREAERASRRQASTATHHPRHKTASFSSWSTASHGPTASYNGSVPERHVDLENLW